MLEQWDRQASMLQRLGGLSPGERAQALDNPAVAVAQRIAAAVPPEGCVAVLAYAGPAAIDYYNARLDYLLYPRKAQVYSKPSAELEGCPVFAVFRDTPQNLALEPYQGNWDDAALAARIAGAERIGGDDLAAVYRRR